MSSLFLSNKRSVQRKTQNRYLQRVERFIRNECPYEKRNSDWERENVGDKPTSLEGRDLGRRGVGVGLHMIRGPDTFKDENIHLWRCPKFAPTLLSFTLYSAKLAPSTALIFKLGLNDTPFLRELHTVSPACFLPKGVRAVNGKDATNSDSRLSDFTGAIPASCGPSTYLSRGHVAP